jgi:diacylglycerol kinase family enzyme
VRVYAVGGDGILSDCLNGIYDVPGTELAAIPYGSSNDFIRSFGDGHIETFRSIAKQIAAPTIPTDIMVTGDGQAILGFFVSGIEALIRYRYLSFLKNFNRQSNPANWITSWFYYVLAIPAMCTRHMRAGNYQIILDWGQEYIHDEGSINLANAPCYGGNKQPNYRAMPNDGYMDLIFLREENLLGDILRIPGYLSGRAYDDPERYIYRRIRHLEIKAATPVPMDNDDEIFLGSSISIEVRHHALQFAAPDGLQYQTRAGAL